MELPPRQRSVRDLHRRPTIRQPCSRKSRPIHSEPFRHKVHVLLAALGCREVVSCLPRSPCGYCGAHFLYKQIPKPHRRGLARWLTESPFSLTLILGPTAAISDVFHWPRGFEASLEAAAN